MDTPNSGDAAVAQINDEQTVAAGRDRSRISFVYNDLEAAVGLAGKLRSNAGSACDVKQLASWMNQSPKGGTFRSILAAARLFGLVETQTGGQVLLTSLGQNALDDTRSPQALADAFLAVELHAAMYRQYEGNALPPAAAIERQLESLGVPPKQKVRARQTFTKSAQFAGFIDPPTGRFIRPATSTASSLEPPKRSGGGGGDGEDGGLNLDPLLVALLRKIPPVGEDWPRAHRVRWFRTFAMNVSQIYDTGDEVVDLVIKVEADESGSLPIRAAS